MTDSGPNDRALRLNAALDGELDAANAWSSSAQSALTWRSRRTIDGFRLCARACGDMSRARRRRRRWSIASPRWAPTPSSVVAFAPLRRPAGGTRACSRSRPPCGRPRLRRRAPDLRRCGKAPNARERRRWPRLRFRPRRNRRPAVRRRLLRPSHGQALARRPHDRQRDIVDLASQGFPLAGGRVAVVDRIPAPTLVYRHNEHLVAVTELPLDASAGARGGGIETIDGYHVARWSDANLAYVAVSDMDEETLADFVQAFRQAAEPGGRIAGAVRRRQAPALPSVGRSQPQSATRGDIRTDLSREAPTLSAPGKGYVPSP